MKTPRVYYLLLIFLAGCSFPPKETLDVAEKLDLFEQVVHEVFASSDWAEFVEYGESSTSIYPGQAYSDSLNQALRRIPKIKLIHLYQDSVVVFKGQYIGPTALRQDCAVVVYTPNGDCIAQLKSYGEINDILSVNSNWCEGQLVYSIAD